MLHLHDPGEGLGAGIVHLNGVLEKLPPQRLLLEPERAVRENAEPVAEVLVDRSGEDRVPEHPARPLVAVTAPETQGDARIREHPLEHPRVTLRRQSLEGLGEASLVAVGADGDAAGERGIQIRRIDAPLLARVVPEKQVVEGAANARPHLFLEVGGRRPGVSPPRQEGLHLHRGRFPAEPLLVGSEIHGKGPVPPGGMGQDPEVDAPPLREAGEIRKDPLRPGPEIMGTVPVQEDSRRIGGVMGVAAEGRPAVHDQHPEVALRRQALGQDSTRESRTHHQDVVTGTAHGFTGPAGKIRLRIRGPRSGSGSGRCRSAP